MPRVFPAICNLPFTAPSLPFLKTPNPAPGPSATPRYSGFPKQALLDFSHMELNEKFQSGHGCRLCSDTLVLVAGSVSKTRTMSYHMGYGRGYEITHLKSWPGQNMVAVKHGDDVDVTALPSSPPRQHSHCPLHLDLPSHLSQSKL